MKDYCQRRDEGDCSGRLSVEHAIIYAGKRVQDSWALIRLCEYHHGIEHYANCNGQDKRKHIEIAMKQATEEDRNKYPRLNWSNVL